MVQSERFSFHNRKVSPEDGHFILAVADAGNGSKVSRGVEIEAKEHKPFSAEARQCRSIYVLFILNYITRSLLPTRAIFRGKFKLHGNGAFPPSAASG